MGLGENGTDPQFDSKIRHIFLFPVNIFSLSGLQNKQTNKKRKNKKKKARFWRAAENGQSLQRFQKSLVS